MEGELALGYPPNLNIPITNNQILIFCLLSLSLSLPPSLLSIPVPLPCLPSPPLPPRPFWLSPRQVMVVPVAGKFDEYGEKVSPPPLPTHTSRSQLLRYPSLVPQLLHWCLSCCSDESQLLQQPSLVWWVWLIMLHLMNFIWAC